MFAADVEVDGEQAIDAAGEEVCRALDEEGGRERFFHIAGLNEE